MRLLPVHTSVPATRSVEKYAAEFGGRVLTWVLDFLYSTGCRMPAAHRARGVQ